MVFTTKKEQPPSVRRRGRSRFVRELIETLTLILLMFVIIRFTVQNYQVEGQSMEPSLHNQEYILVDKAVFLFHAPARGDVIVFQYPLDHHLYYIKRIIAIPGDVISITGTIVTVDGIKLNEPYVNTADNFNPFPSFENRLVGPGEYFVMGDNRGDSSDSRQWGFVPRTNIIGKADFIYWPLQTDNFGLLPNYSDVFAKVHQ